MHITIMRGVYTPIDPMDQIEADWDTVATVLSEFWKKPKKEHNPMFNLWQFKTIEDGAELGRKYAKNEDGTTDKTRWTDVENTVRRCAPNALGLWGIVLDYDGAKTLADALDDLVGVECVVYTTFNHSSEKNKFRVVIPFSRMMPKEEFRSKLEDIKRRYPDADNASFSESQAIYLHSGAQPELAFCARLSGAMIDPDMFEVTPPQPVDTTPVRVYEGEFDQHEPYKAAVLQALMSCSGVRRGASREDANLLGLAQIVKSVSGTFGDFDAICDAVLDFDSTARSDRSIRRGAWDSSYGGNVTAKFRDKWIGDHGGTAVKSFMPVNRVNALEQRIRDLYKARKQ